MSLRITSHGRTAWGRVLFSPTRTSSDPHVEHALTTGNSAFLERTADFIEGLCLTGGDYAMSVVYIGVLEGLKANCDNEKVRAFLKPVTRKQFDELAY